jgi:hypothetical protein
MSCKQVYYSIVLSVQFGINSKHSQGLVLSCWGTDTDTDTDIEASFELRAS